MKKLNILIITHELHGISERTEVGTYNYFLSRFLKDEGHDVSILYLNQINANTRKNQELIYKDIPILQLPIWTGQKFGRDAPNLYKSFEIYRWAKTQSYDLIFYNDALGYGYYLTEAKRQGYAFQDTLLVGSLLSPKELSWDISNVTVPDIQSYITAHIEKKSMEQADILLTQSQSLLDLLSKKGWQYPKECHVLPPLSTDESPILRASDSVINELIFIGPLNTANGYDVFLATLKRAYAQNPALLKDMHFAFLGQGSLDAFVDENPIFKGHIKHFPTFDFSDIQRYVSQPNRLVIFTQKSCTLNYAHILAIYDNVNFIGQRNGFLEQLIHVDDVDSVLTTPLNPTPLANKLLNVLEKNCSLSIKPFSSLSENKEKWIKFYQMLSEQVLLLKEHQEEPRVFEPFVSVCISHYNRPDQLIDALKSLELQDYKNFEVLVMDDGSTVENKEALKQTIEPFMKKHGWRLFYQDNQFMNAARNNLVPHAKGDWLMFMDDDDIALPDEVSRFIHIAHKTKAQIISTNFYVANHTKHTADVLSLTLGDALVPSLFGLNYLGGTNILIQKDAFLKIGGWYDHYGFSFTDQYLPVAAILNDLKLVVSVEPTFIYNLIGTNHIGHTDQKILPFQYRIISECYAKMLPTEFRNLPFLTYSLADECIKLKLENISAKEIIKHRLKKKVAMFVDFIKYPFVARK